MTEDEAKALLSSYGIPVNRTEAAQGRMKPFTGRGMGYPVGLKILSRDILHKTDAQGVELNLQLPEDVRGAYENIMARARAIIRRPG